MRTMEVQRNYVIWMHNFNSKRDGVLPVESRRAGRVPGPVPQKGPPRVTGGPPVPIPGARLRRRRVNATDRKKKNNNNNKQTKIPDPDRTTRPLNILQWNAEGVYNRKVSLTDRLHKEDIDVACN